MASQFARELHGSTSYVVYAWSHEIINTFWQEIIGGGGIVWPPKNVLYGVRYSP